MKKMGFKVFLLLLLVILALSGVSAQEKEDVIVYYVDLIDSNGYTYGVDFFVDSSVNGQVYVTAHIISRENVNGDVISGTALLQSNEKRFRIGSFICKDQSKGWSISVGIEWERAD